MAQAHIPVPKGGSGTEKGGLGPKQNIPGDQALGPAAPFEERVA